MSVAVVEYSNTHNTISDMQLPENLAGSITNIVPPEFVAVGIIFASLSGTLFFVWNIIGPVLLWCRQKITHLCYREIEVHIADSDYHKFNTWLEQNQKHTYFQRSYKVVNAYGQHEEYDSDDPLDEDAKDFQPSQLVSGYGSCLVRAPGAALVWVTRSKVESTQTFKQTETLKFKIFSISQDPVKDFFRVVTNIKTKAGPFIYTAPNGYWMRVGKPKGVLPPIGKSSKDLVDSVQRFLDSKEEFNKRGIPFKKGYMLTGEPGTGKTSLVSYVAYKFDMNVFVLNSSSIAKFEQLRTTIKPNSIIVIEDADMTAIGTKRTKLMSDDDVGDDPDTKDYQAVLNQDTMREFLNTLDGIGEFTDCLFFMTTNKPQVMDPALTRPGRIDEQMHIGLYTPSEQIQHINRFFDVSLNEADYVSIGNRSVADLQLMCVTHMHDVDKVLELL